MHSRILTVCSGDWIVPSIFSLQPQHLQAKTASLNALHQLGPRIIARSTAGVSAFRPDRDTWLVDNETIFYVDIGARFFLPDGSHNQEMWRYPPVSGLVNVGTQAAAYEVWAEELQPWLDRFVR